jgi:hypothetical protein
VAKLVVFAAEIDPQHTEMVTMLSAFHSGGNAVAFLRPLPDDFVVRGDQAAALALRLVLR